MCFTVHIIFINFDRHSLDLGRGICLAPEGFKRSISGPRPKKVVHHCATGYFFFYFSGGGSAQPQWRSISSHDKARMKVCSFTNFALLCTQDKLISDILALILLQAGCIFTLP